MRLGALAMNEALGLVVLAALCGGCFGSSKSSSFYTLNSVVQAAGEAPLADLSLVVGPLALPEYLDRPQIVTRRTPNRLRVDEFHRWAGSLKGEALRVVAENLSRLLGTAGVVAYPNEASGRPGYRVSLEVRRFDGVLDDQVVLDVRWTLESVAPYKLLAQRRTHLTEPIQQDDAEHLVAAQSRLLGRLSQEIARSLRRLARTGG
jgi:uncharacterized lipoprotein YmbA